MEITQYRKGVEFLKIGVICPSEIALRRFMPALQKIYGLEFAGVGIYTGEERFGINYEKNDITENTLKREYEKAQVFINKYGGKIFEGYNAVVTSKQIDAVYIPLPPALHYKWAKLALENGKHVIVEKPSTTSLSETTELINLAQSKGLVLHENYMFIYHKQIDEINNIIISGELGDIRLFRINFGFPLRSENDFRYNNELGGGALFDAGGYTLKYAAMLLGESARVICANLNYLDKFNVDMYGSGMLVNDSGLTVQIAFGMDNNYKCELEMWGSKGCLTTGRILTAPEGFIPEVTIRKGNTDETRKLSSDDSFKKSIRYFQDCINSDKTRKKNYNEILKQSILVEDFKKHAGI